MISSDRGVPFGSEPPRIRGLPSRQRASAHSKAARASEGESARPRSLFELGEYPIMLRNVNLTGRKHAGICDLQSSPASVMSDPDNFQKVVKRIWRCCYARSTHGL